MEQQLGLSVEEVTQHSQNLFTKSEELNDALTDILGKLSTMMEDGQTYADVSSSKIMYEKIKRFSSSVTKYVEGVQKFASFLVNETIATYETSDQDILNLQSQLNDSLADLELASKLGDGNINASQLDFSKISSNSGDAASGAFIQEGNVHKEYWEGELQLVPREDGTIQIVKDGTVMGYTTEEGVNLPDATDASVENFDPEKLGINADVDNLVAQKAAQKGAIVSNTGEAATSTEEMNAALENGTAGEGAIGVSDINSNETIVSESPDYSTSVGFNAAMSTNSGAGSSASDTTISTSFGSFNESNSGTTSTTPPWSTEHLATTTSEPITSFDTGIDANTTQSNSDPVTFSDLADKSVYESFADGSVSKILDQTLAESFGIDDK